jgi:hypothetical protein
MRIAYTTTQRREAVALSRVVGVEAAAASLNIDPRTIRGWVARAGHPPELEGNAAAWQRAFDLAHAKVEGILASGKASAVTAATIMGIAQRNLAAIERRDQATSKPTDQSTTVQQAIDELEARLADIYPGVDLSLILRVLLAHERLTGYVEPEMAEATGEDALAGWLEVLAGLVQEHGSIEAAHQWQRAEEHRRLEEQLARNKAASEAAMASARQATLDRETQAILQAAENFLKRHDDG